MTPSVLASVGPADVRMSPWPHLVIEDCLPSGLYRALAAAYPDDATVLANVDERRRRPLADNQRNDIGAARALAVDAVAPVWRDFVRHHVSAAFMADVARVFGPAVRSVYPDLETRLGGRLDTLGVGTRHDPASDIRPLSLDCQIGINTPVRRPGRVRGVHADAPVELYAMLLYFRRDDDDRAGGDLEICAWKPGRARRFAGARVADRDVRRVATVPYRANTLVAFLNTEASVHAVTPRPPTPCSRRLVNLVGEVYNAMPEGLFTMQQRPRPLQRLRDWFAGPPRPAALARR